VDAPWLRFAVLSPAAVYVIDGEEVGVAFAAACALTPVGSKNRDLVTESPERVQIVVAPALDLSWQRFVLAAPT